ncbi:Uncharacterized protein FWK35_00014335 [Aphis craccivora]|uniref:Reverse transcriptase domain-containing protein n=1 Tax=Aphis craccivora TaxID=307492 RepID=A0A6G0Z736_APHCR|nr:Uncharacterized protein FWK35_00014335 [Aphis craccivora]
MYISSIKILPMQWKKNYSAQLFYWTLPKRLINILPPPYFLYFKSYLENRNFVTQVGSAISNLSPILAGVSQDQLSTPHTSVAEFTVDKIIFTSHHIPQTASQYLQNHLNMMESLYSKWKIKINNEKSSHITFSLKQNLVPPVALNYKIISQTSNVRYLGLIY